MPRSPFPPGSDAESVRALYNEKAQSWRKKYDVDGPLSHRIAAFQDRLEEVVPAPARVLDFGCGTGNLSFQLSGRGYSLTSCDIADRMIEEAKSAFPAAPIDWQLLPADWERLPFDSETFDAIVASSVFEYVTELDEVLAECARVLKPHGVLIVSVPNPEHAVRKVEEVLRTVSSPVSRLARERLPARWSSYFGYLALSRNRLTAQEWAQRVKPLGLDVENVRPLGTPIAGFFLTQSPLMLLTFRR